MKLESVADRGRDKLPVKPIIKGNVLETTNLLLTIFENIQRVSTADLAYFAHAYLARGLASLAIEKAQETGAVAVGFSGGAACNYFTSKDYPRGD